MSNAAKIKMPYRFLGDSGLLVSTLALGSWMDYNPTRTVDDWYPLVKTAYEHGINYFDTAENYDDGNAEVLLGGAIKKGIDEGIWNREDLVVNAKFFAGSKGFFQCGPNGQGSSRKHLVEGIKSSLKKLQLDYVDVVFCHRPEAYTPIEETVRAMNFIIDQGWAFYWGTSEWPPSAIDEACAIADRLGLIRPIVEQPQYNIFERSKVEFQYVDAYKKHKLGLTVWSPLASGLLTGKYSKGISKDTRLADSAIRSLFPNFEEQVSTVQQLEPIAKKLGCSLAQLAVAWCASNENVSTVLIGARTPAQLEETVQALNIVSKITPEVKAEIDAIVPFVPKLWQPDVFYTIRARHLENGPIEVPAWANSMSPKLK
eukprot:jgi/Phyca11/129521/e_gw1.85.33.1